MYRLSTRLVSATITTKTKTTITTIITKRFYNREWRFPKDKVTSDDIATYRKEIKQIGEEETKHEIQRFTTYSVSSEMTMYFFTDENHPAHPSVIKRSVKESNNKVYTDIQGHYAGDRAYYEQFWKMFIESDRQMIKNFKEQNDQK